jgi:hypothetical protein
MDENIAKISELILEVHWRIVDGLVDLSGVSWSSCQRILSEELQMKRVEAKSGEWWLQHDSAPGHNF